jgi:hypothetical protein
MNHATRTDLFRLTVNSEYLLAALYVFIPSYLQFLSCHRRLAASRIELRPKDQCFTSLLDFE